MKNIKVLLLQIRNKDSFAVRILHRLIEQEGYVVKSLFVYDHFFQPLLSPREVNLVIKYIETDKPDVIGISLTSYEYKEAIEISNRVREVHPEILIIWGGIHPTIAPESCVEYCDFACIGEGEGAILDIVRLLEERKPKGEFRAIPNLAFKYNNKYYINPVRPPIDNLDSIPFPDFSNKNKIYFHGRQPNIFFNISFTPQYSDEEVYQIMTSRGCLNRCSYCCSSYTRELYRGYCYLRHRSVNSTIEELIQAKINQPKVKYIIFADDIFTIDFPWIKEFIQEYRLKVSLPFRCNGHVNDINGEVIAILKNAGLKEISIGIQSGSERIRKEIFLRNTSDENIMRAALIFKKYKIRVIYDLICSPFETQKDKRESFKLFLKIPKPFMFHIHEIAYYMRAPITEYAMQRNIISEDDIVGNLQGRTQGIYNPHIYYGNNFIGNDPHYRLLKTFGRRYIPNFIIKLLVNIDSRIVKSIIYIACVFKKLSYRIFKIISGK